MKKVLTIKSVFLCIAIFLLVLSCKNTNRACGLEVADISFQERIPSAVKISELFRIADTTTVSISGKIYGDDFHTDNFHEDDVLPFTNVVLTDIKTQKVFDTITDFDGAFSFEVHAATYQLQVHFIGFNSVIVDSLKLGTGEIFNISAHLGMGIDKEYFEIQTGKSNRKIIRKTN